MDDPLSVLKEIFELIDGPWDDPVISEELYNKMKKVIEDAESQL